MYECKECGTEIVISRDTHVIAGIKRNVELTTIQQSSGTPACGICLAFVANLMGGEAWPTGIHPNWTEQE